MSVNVNNAAIEALGKSPEATDFLLEVAQRGADAARNAAPVDTGTLRDSIYAKAEAGHAEFGASADYALYVEYGTSTEPAQPFLRPALDQMGGN